MGSLCDSNFSVMIVEDDDAARDIIANIVGLKFPDCAIYTAENGRKGLELFKAHTPDIVLTDINMPEMNGIEMVREIRSINADASCIVLTAYRDKELMERFTEIGYCAYLLKPVNFVELFSALEKCSIGIKKR